MKHRYEQNVQSPSSSNIQKPRILGNFILEDVMVKSGAEGVARREAAKGKIAEHAVSSFAFAMLDKAERDKHDGKETDLSRQFLFTSKIPGWLERQASLELVLDELEAQKSRHWSKWDHDKIDELTTKKQEHLDKIIDFNHLLGRMIRAKQFTKLSQIKKYTKAVLISNNVGVDGLERADDYIGRTVNGIRHEIAAFSALEGIDGVTVTAPNKEQEKNGIDVIIDDGFHVSVADIKSNQRDANEANRKSRSTLAIWSGFDNREFGDNLFLRPDRLQSAEIVHYYKNILEDIDLDTRTA